MAPERPYRHESATEHAVAADRCAREIVPFLKRIGGALAAAERQPVGRVSCRRPARSRIVVSGGFAFGCRAAPKERVARGVEARGAGCDSRQRLHKPKAYRSPWCWVWFRSAWCCRAPLFVAGHGWWCMPPFGVRWALPPNPPMQPTASRTRSLAF
jgi:hypothetical protein